MNILYVCHRFPFPPKRGGKIRPFNMIRHLSQNHDVTVASLVRSGTEAEEGRGLDGHCARYSMARVAAPSSFLRMLLRLPTSVPSSMGYFYSPALARHIRRELSNRSFDLIVVHCSSVAQYVQNVDSIPKILDFGDMDSQKWLSYGRFRPWPWSLGFYLEGLKLQLTEMELSRRFDTCTCTTRAELRTLRGFGTGVRADWFPNGVDAERFRPSEEPYDPDTICFVGRMDYYPNRQCMLQFCSATLPLIRARRPQTRLIIVGANPSPEIRRLGELPGVTVTGTVPQVQPYVHKAAATVAPLDIARGTQNKILESMAMGVPCVCSELALGGIDAVAGEHVLTGDRPAGYAEAVLRILENPTERSRLAESGRKRILTHHDWDSSMRKLDTIIEQCLADVRRDRRPTESLTR